MPFSGTKHAAFQSRTDSDRTSPPLVATSTLSAGVSLATGLHIGDLSSWAQLASRDALLKLAPALAMVLLITAVLHRVRWGYAHVISLGRQCSTPRLPDRPTLPASAPLRPTLPVSPPQEPVCAARPATGRPRPLLWRAGCVQLVAG